MEQKGNKTELVTFMCDPVLDKGLKLRAKVKGNTKSLFYRDIIKDYISKNSIKE